MRLSRVMFMGAMLVTPAACAAPSSPAAYRPPPAVNQPLLGEQTPFMRALEAQYRAEAWEAWTAREDTAWWQSLSEEANAARRGRPSAPVDVPDTGQAADAANLSKAYEELIEDFAFGARGTSPVVAAAAQGRLRCWALGDGAVGDDALDVDRRRAAAQCRDQARAALAMLSVGVDVQPVAHAIRLDFSKDGAQFNSEQGGRVRDMVEQMRLGHDRHVVMIGPAGGSVDLFWGRVRVLAEVLGRFGISPDHIGVRTLDGVVPIDHLPHPGSYWVVIEPVAGARLQKAHF